MTTPQHTTQHTHIWSLFIKLEVLYPYTPHY